MSGINDVENWAEEKVQQVSCNSAVQDVANYIQDKYSFKGQLEDAILDAIFGDQEVKDAGY